jgi:hypothetical protein
MTLYIFRSSANNKYWEKELWYKTSTKMLNRRGSEEDPRGIPKA